jgi:hypothetical protein
LRDGACRRCDGGEKRERPFAACQADQILAPDSVSSVALSSTRASGST